MPVVTEEVHHRRHKQDAAISAQQHNKHTCDDPKSQNE